MPFFVSIPMDRVRFMKFDWPAEACSSSILLAPLFIALAWISSFFSSLPRSVFCLASVSGGIGISWASVPLSMIRRMILRVLAASSSSFALVPFSCVSINEDMASLLVCAAPFFVLGVAMPFRFS